MDAQTMRYARNWAKHLMKKAARPKRVVTEKMLENLAKGRRIRAANLAKMSGGSAVGEYVAQAGRHLADKYGEHFGSVGRAAKSSAWKQAAEDFAQKGLAHSSKDFMSAPKHLYKGLAAAGAATAAGAAYGIHKAMKATRRALMTPEQAEIRQEMQEAVAHAGPFTERQKQGGAKKRRIAVE